MTGQDFLFTGLIPLALLAVLGVVLASGRLKPETRSGLERALVTVFYPLFVVFALWRAFAHFRERDMTTSLLFGVAAVGVLHEGLKLFRRRRMAALAAAKAGPE